MMQASSYPRYRTLIYGNSELVAIPAKAGIQKINSLTPGLRRGDESGLVKTIVTTMFSE